MSRQSSLSSVLDSDQAMSGPSTTATGAVPALGSDSSATSSTRSADTNIASALDGGYLLESHEGVLIVPNRYHPNAHLLCPFQILDCDRAFSETRDFKMHVFSHFKGHNTPESASCFLCDRKFKQGSEDHAAKAWNEMLSHLAEDHFRQGQRLATVRTDFTLMRWMYNRRLITDAEFKRTQLRSRPIFSPVGTGSGRDELVNLPRAPTPPVSAAGSSRPMIRPPRRVRDDAFFTHASQRSERRGREATRTMLTT